MVILENIDIDKAILQNIDIDKISNRFKFGISNRASEQGRELGEYGRKERTFWFQKGKDGQTVQNLNF